MRQCLVYLCITSLWKACWSTALSSLSNVQQHQQQRNYLRSAPDADVGIEQLLIPSAIQTPPHQNRQQQQQQPDDDSPEEQRRKNCPSPEYSVFRCDDPTGDWILPCDRDTCEWDQSSLSPDQAPEFCLDFVTIDDPNEVDLPDEVKPCALWEIIHGVDNTPSPVPTLTPTLGTYTLQLVEENVTGLRHFLNEL